MALHFEWTPAMSVGEQMIDSQHQRLLGQVNTLIDAMVFGSASTEVTTALDFLEQYINEHLSYEEEYMERRGFRDLTEHKAKHAEFRNKYAAFKAKLDAGETPDTVLVGIEEFLGQWWIDHIGHEDHAYFLALGPTE